MRAVGAGHRVASPAWPLRPGTRLRSQGLCHTVPGLVGRRVHDTRLPGQGLCHKVPGRVVRLVHDCLCCRGRRHRCRRSRCHGWRRNGQPRAWCCRRPSTPSSRGSAGTVCHARSAHQPRPRKAVLLGAKASNA